MLAIIPATFVFLAIPPTIIPIENIETITNNHPIINSTILPSILKSKNSTATANRLIKDIKAYIKYTVTSASNIIIGVMGVTLNLFRTCLLL